jgi:hypothetical protein
MERRRVMERRRHCPSIAWFIAALAMPAASFAQEPCRARVVITIDAEVPDTRDPGFLSGLLANPRYRLTWVTGDGSSVVYDLSGPAEDQGCTNGIDQIRRGATVLDVKVLAPEAPLDQASL